MKILYVCVLVLAALVLNATSAKIKTNIFSRSNNVCPSGGSCPGDQSCCPIYSGGEGCCPYPNAVCCSDKKHCCPSYSICLFGKCFLPANESSSISLTKPNNLCPDGEVCPGSATCCRSAGPTQYACCSLNDAVCCSDGKHCCPSGTTCNLSNQTCDSVNKMEELEVLVDDKKEDNMIQEHSSIVPCPGGQVACLDGQTCCKLSSGNWGCCPLPKATCCPDGVHCCPSGSTCSASQCRYADNFSVPFSTKVPSIPFY